MGYTKRKKIETLRQRKIASDSLDESTSLSELVRHSEADFLYFFSFFFLVALSHFHLLISAPVSSIWHCMVGGAKVLSKPDVVQHYKILPHLHSIIATP